jgi:hypothetical protein
MSGSSVYAFGNSEADAMTRSVLVLVGVPAIAIGTAGLWSCTRSAPVPASAEAPAVPTAGVQASPAKSALPSPATNASAAVAACPLLTPGAFEQMSARLALATLEPDEIALVAVGLGDQGLAALRAEQSAEIGRLFAGVFVGMSPEQREAFTSAIGLLRDGRALTPAHAVSAAEALRAGAGRLRPDDLERLRSLYSASIESGFAARAAATERTRTAVAVTVPDARGASRIRQASVPGARAAYQSAPSAAVSPGPVSAPSDAAIESAARARDAQEASWRRRRADADARVKAAEAALAEAERASTQARPLGPEVPSGGGGDLIALQTGQKTAIQLRDEARAREARERANPTPPLATRTALTVDQARANLMAARAAVDRLEDEARKAGVPAGWVR